MPTKTQIRSSCTVAAVVLVAVLSLQNVNHAQEKKAMDMNVKRITPVLFVKEIEPVLPFWVDKLGFTKTIEVPHGNKIGFVALQKGSTEVMYQSYASVEEDMPLIAETRKGPTFFVHRGGQSGRGPQRAERLQDRATRANRVLRHARNRFPGAGRTLRHVRATGGRRATLNPSN